LEVDEDLEIKQAGLLPTLFHLLLEADVILRQKVLQDMCLLLNKRFGQHNNKFCIILTK